VATDPEVRVRFPALPDFLRSNGSGRGPLSLVSTTEELLGRKSSGSGLENREYGRRDPPPRGTLYSKELALPSPTSGARSVGIVRSRTQATEFLRKKVVGLERGPLSLVSTTEELLDRKVAAPV
jgi:hypothetical protein